MLNACNRFGLGRRSVELHTVGLALQHTQVNIISVTSILTGCEADGDVNLDRSCTCAHLRPVGGPKPRCIPPAALRPANNADQQCFRQSGETWILRLKGKRA